MTGCLLACQSLCDFRLSSQEGFYHESWVARMTTLTKTRIEIADRHTSLYGLAPKATGPDALGMVGNGKYRGLYEKIAKARSAHYSDLTGKPGAILEKLSPVIPEDPYKPLKYWLWYLERGPDLSDVWREAIPIVATMNRRIEIIAPTAFPAKLSLLPQIVLYPFGWSAWFSVLVTGNHAMKDLSALVEHLFQQKPFKSSLSAKPLTLTAHFELVAEGVRTDVFGGPATRDTKDVNTAHVITVLEKNGGSPGLDGLGIEGEQQLRSLVRPVGARSRKAFQDLVFHFKAKDQENYDLNYLVADQLGRFIWMEELLEARGTNQMRLECYHHNSFRALVQAWHFYGLIKYSSEDGLVRRWSSSKKETVPVRSGEQEEDSLAALLSSAFRRLDDFRYRNAGLRVFLESDSVRKQVDASRKEAVSLRLLPPGRGESTQPNVDK